MHSPKKMFFTVFSKGCTKYHNGMYKHKSMYVLLIFFQKYQEKYNTYFKILNLHTYSFTFPDYS